MDDTQIELIRHSEDCVTAIDTYTGASFTDKTISEAFNGLRYVVHQIWEEQAQLNTK